jgi:magnesium chelatase family protein
VEVMRGQRSLGFPANAMVVAACNRCPCARPAEACACSRAEQLRYQRRLSGPLLDRIDLICQVEPVPSLALAGERRTAPASPGIRARVVAARERQRTRLARHGVLCNGDMDGRLTRLEVPLDPRLAERLRAAGDRLNLSARGHDRVLRVARTIADLAASERVKGNHLDEALSYRFDGVGAMAA